MYLFDIFSKPFILRVGIEQESKKTNFGGIVTLIVISLSLTYFISILIVFFSRDTPPTIKTKKLINNEPTKPEFILRNPNSKDLYYSPLSIGVRIPDINNL